MGLRKAMAVALGGLRGCSGKGSTQLTQVEDVHGGLGPPEERRAGRLDRGRAERCGRAARPTRPRGRRPHKSARSGPDPPGQTRQRVAGREPAEAGVFAWPLEELQSAAVVLVANA